MFPPLCLPAASGEFFTEEQSKRVEESHDYEIKFAIFEALQGLFGGEDETSEDKNTDESISYETNDFGQIAVLGAVNCILS